MKTSNIIMIVIFVVLTVAAIAGVVYGVSTHTEPGFMDDRPGWDRGDFPLSISYHQYTDSDYDNHAEIVEDVVGLINGRLGFMAYRVSSESGDTPIRITFDVPAEPGWQDPGGSAEIHAAQCDIATANTGTDEMLELVLHHELGHCLGLAHDPGYAQSIMRPVQVPTPEGSMPPWIDDFDRALLRTEYLE